MTAKQTQFIPHVCIECLSGCALKVRVEDGVVARIEGHPRAPGNLGRICPKGNAAMMRVYDPQRLLKPMKRTNPEKGMGIDPGWQEIGWDEAMDIVAARMKEQQQENPAGLMVGSMDITRCWVLTPWGRLFGTISTGAAAGIPASFLCGNASHTLGDITFGTYTEHADYAKCNYLLMMGSGTGHEASHALPYTARMIADARMRGMKLVVVDPRLSNAAAKADEWVPIRPGADGALVLGMIHVLLHELRVWDSPCLQGYTNAPYLIQDNGYYLRQPGSNKPMVWDARRGEARAFDDVDASAMALEGEYTVAGNRVRPAFQLFVERTRPYTPEWTERETTVPAAQVRKMARDMAEAAQIGSSVELDGERWPYRPVAIVFYRAIQAHKYGGKQAMSIYMLMMLLGSLGAVGGKFPILTSTLRSGVPLLTPDEDGVVDHHNLWHLMPYREPKFPPEQPNLREWIPLASPDPGATYHITGADPERFGLARKLMLISDVSNPMHGLADLGIMETSLKNTFVVLVEHHMTDSHWMADIMLPATMQLERATYAVLRGNDVQGLAYGPRILAPAGEARDFMDIMFELSERLGLLYGPDGFNACFNNMYGLEAPWALAEDKKYTWDEVAERVAFGSAGAVGGAELRRDGIYISKVKTAQEKYMLHRNTRMPFYHELLLRTADELKAKMAEVQLEAKWGLKWDFANYDPLPSWETTWRQAQRQDGYDLLAINYKPVSMALSRSAYNPWLMEITERHPYHLHIWINTETARQRRIADGDTICVESRVGKVTGRARLTEGVHPECVAIAGTLGQKVSHTIARNKGIHFNALTALNMDHVDTLTGGLDTKPAVKVYPVARGR